MPTHDRRVGTFSAEQSQMELTLRDAHNHNRQQRLLDWPPATLDNPKAIQGIFARAIMKLFPANRYGQWFSLEGPSATGNLKTLEMHLSDTTQRFESGVLRRLWSPVLDVTAEGSPSQSLLNTTLPLEPACLQLRRTPREKDVVLPRPFTWKSFWDGTKLLYPECVGMRSKVVLSWFSTDGVRESRTVCETSNPETESLDALFHDIQNSKQTVFDVRLYFVRTLRIISLYMLLMLSRMS